MAAIENQVEELERRALELQPDIGHTANLAQEILRLKRACEDLTESAQQRPKTALGERLSRLDDDVEKLRRALYSAAQVSPVDEPPLVDMRWKTAVAPGRGYAKRSLDDVKYVVIEHTATLEDVSPELLAQMHLEQGKAAIACHFLVGRAGTIYWTQPLENAVSHALLAQINQHSISVSLAGSFNSQPPEASQLEATAALLAWLVSIFGLGIKAIRGRRELEAVASPGAQWSSGANYRQALLELVRERLHIPGEPSVPPLQRIALQDPAPPAKAAATPLGLVPRPNIVDVVSSLPRHPTLEPYPVRSKPASAIAIHHTDTLRTITVQQIAQYHVYGVRKAADGRVIKAQWPGIGYHFLVAPNGTIYQCQREETRSYHVGGNANDSCLGVSFIGRFMRLGYDGKPQAAEDQIPTPAQLRSGGQLAAWLMQELAIPLEKVMGHKNVVGGGTACPGEHWEGGLKWRGLLQKEIEAVIQAAQESPGDQPLEHYLLFWDHGTAWAAADWSNAQTYFAHFRPTTGFSVQDALQARHVTIVGGPAGVSPADEARLKAAGVRVQRLSGADEAETKAMLDSLVAKDTPWPGAQTRSLSAAIEAKPIEPEAALDERAAEFEPDEWTIPDDWENLIAPVDGSGESPTQTSTE